MTVAARPLARRRLARFRELWSDFAESRVAVAALVVFGGLVLLAVCAPLVAPTDPYDLASIDLLDSRLPPGEVSMTGMTFWLGTDGQGRDLLSAIIYGLRLSLIVGFASGFVALVIGTTVGMFAAHAGGRVDALVMRLVDLQLSFPAILLALMLLAAFGRGVDKVIVALILVQWATYCRTVRAAALVEKTKEYMEAAAVLRLSRGAVLFRHLLPNCLSAVIVLATVQIANSIALEATLSFLGVGLPPTEPSLGLLIANGFDYVLSGTYWISLFPGIALIVLIVSINLVGDQIRDVLNPRLQL